MVIKNKVFDCTGSPFYSPGGPYEMFAGRDVSIACALNSLEVEHLDKPWDPDATDLKFSQMESLQDFFLRFCQKYPIRGNLIRDFSKSKNE